MKLSFGLLKKNKKLTYLVIALLGLIVLFFIFSGGGSVSKTKSSSSHTVNSKSSDSKNLSQQVSLKSLPSNISCSTQATQVPLENGYLVTDLNCRPNNDSSANPVLTCNGTIFHFQVSIDCYQPGNNPYSKNQLVCNGNMTSFVSNSGLPLSYNCTLNSLTSRTIYTCSGALNGYSPNLVSLPMSVSCGP